MEWSLKIQRISIITTKYSTVKSLYKVLFKEESIDWTKTEIMVYHLKEKFNLYYMNWVINSNFGKKP